MLKVYLNEESKDKALAELIPLIRADLDGEQEAERETYARRRKVGENLSRAKELLGHGEWGRWLAENFDLTERTARRYMEFGETDVTSDMEKTKEDWNRINGNTPKGGEGEQGVKKCRPRLLVNEGWRGFLRIDLTNEADDPPKDTPITDDHYDADKVIGHGTLYGKNVNVYRPDGTLLLVFRPRAVRAELCGLVHQSLRKAAHWSENRKAESGIVGFYDSPAPVPAAFNTEHPHDWLRLQPYLRAMDRIFRREVPDRYAHQLAAVAATDARLVIRDTVFTTMTVNRNVPFEAHRDANNLAGSFAVMSVFRAGSYGGGRLVFPRWRVAIEATTRDVLIADVSETHGVTPIIGTEDQYERISTVSYFREGLLGKMSERSLASYLEERLGRAAARYLEERLGRAE